MFDRKTERTAASLGASVGASLGRGPVSAGVAAGFGGALGYLAGAACPCGRKRLLPDGGRERDGGVSIPVADEREQ